MNKIIIYTFLTIISVIAFFQLNAYLFNHVNPWLGILVMIVGIGTTLLLFTNFVKKQIKKK